MRKVARSTLAGELHAVVEHIDFVDPVEKIYSDFFGGGVVANVAIDCESLFAHIHNGKDVAERALILPFQTLKMNIKDGVINNVCLIGGDDNPADPLTKSDRARTKSLKSLMSAQTMPKIKPFKWLKMKPSLFE